MKPATVLALISLVGVVALAVVHLEQRERLRGVQEENWALRGRLDDITNQLDQFAPLGNLLARADQPEIENAYSSRQVIGPPDAGAEPGDSPLAWCPPDRDSGRPWLLLSFPNDLAVIGLEVHANWNPGAVVLVEGIRPDDSAIVLWEGEQQKGQTVTALSFEKPTAAPQFRLTLDPSRVPGWNEIDAVRAVFENGEGAWASAAEASATWRSTE